MSFVTFLKIYLIASFVFFLTIRDNLSSHIEKFYVYIFIFIFKVYLNVYSEIFVFSFIVSGFSLIFKLDLIYKLDIYK